MTSSTQRLWFITGAGRGLGRAFTEAALAQGDRVVGTVRDEAALADLVATADGRLIVKVLDVTDRAGVSSVAADVVHSVGVPDVVVNNAGYGLVGAVEELTPEQITAQFDVNFFGAVWVTQAFVPHLRERGSGRIVQVSTVGAVGHLPLFGAYNASKWALEGLSAALADELAGHGVGVHLLQLGGFATDWAGASMQFADENPAYAANREAVFGSAAYRRDAGEAPEVANDAATDDTAADDAPAAEDPFADAEPGVAAQALIDLVNDPAPPLRIVAGNGAQDMVRMALEDRRDDYERTPGFTWPGPAKE